MVNQILPRVKSVTASALAVPFAEPAISPAARHLQLGRELYGAGRINEAIAIFRSGLDAATDASDDAVAALCAELGDAFCGFAGRTTPSRFFSGRSRRSPRMGRSSRSVDPALGYSVTRTST